MFSGFSAALVMMTTLASAPQSMVLEFSTAGCVPCQSMAPIVHKLQQEGYAIQQISAQQQPELAQRFRVRMYPTFILINNGQEEERIEGMISESRLRELTPKLEAIDALTAAEQPANSKSILTQGIAGMTVANGATGYERAVLGQPAIPNELKANPPKNLNTPNMSMQSANTEIDKYLPDIEIPSKLPVIRGQSASATNPKDVKPASDDPLLASTVRIRIREKNGVNFGTGTIIESKQGRAVILTCAHILRDLSADGKIEIEFFTVNGPIMMVGKRLSDNIDADVGLVTVPSDMVFPTVKVASLNNSCRLNDPVVSYGCSAGQDPTREELTVSACNKYVGPENIECTGVPTRGRSGGGLFNTKGEIIGICSAADPQANRGLYCGLLPILEMLKSQQLEQLIQMTNTNRAVADASLENNFPPDIETLNNKLLARLDETKNSPLAKSIESLIPNNPEEAIKQPTANSTNFTSLNQAQGSKLTIIIEVPGSPEKTRTVIIPAATEKLIREITRDKEHKNNHQGFLDIGLRRNLQPTYLSITLDTIPVISRPVNPGWQSRSSLFSATISQNLSKNNADLIEPYSQTTFKKYIRNASTVVRNNNLVNNSIFIMEETSSRTYYSEIAPLGSYGLNQNRQVSIKSFSVRHPSIKF